jgi:6-pyruvoyltetrahydropterin/6-carboxytetrahydropterin synthase
MFEIFIETHFSAGHHLRNYPGNCEKPHGHNWKVKVAVRAEKLDELGMGIDFRNIKQAVNKVIDDIDHCNLNEHPGFLDRNPSSENIAVYIFNSLQGKLRGENYRLYSVSTYETENSGTTYFGDHNPS